MTKNLTIKEFSEIIQQDYISTTALVKLMVMVGAAKHVGQRKVDGQKGKPSSVYEIWPSFEVDFWKEPEQDENTIDNPAEPANVVETSEVPA